jgi:hypothetical protein
VSKLAMDLHALQYTVMSDRDFRLVCYSKSGQKISPFDWLELHMDPLYGFLQEDQVADWVVTSCWTGVDSREDVVEDEPPHTFMTLIEDETDVVYRFTSWSEEVAQTFHAMAVSQLRSGAHPEEIEFKGPWN